MNREKKDQLPAMQVAFIDSICAPVYEVCMICLEIEGFRLNEIVNDNFEMIFS